MIQLRERIRRLGRTSAGAAGSPALLACGLLLAGCASGRRGEPGFEQIQTTSVPAAGARILGLLTSGQGSLVVYGSETDSLSVRYAVSAETRAGLFRNQVETIEKDDSLFVTIRPIATSSIDLQVEMPEGLAVNLRDEGRNVVLRNTENRVDVFLHAGGSLDFDDIDGPLQIQDGTGPIRIHDVRGPIVIDDKGGGIVVRQVTNSIRIGAGPGDITIEHVSRDVHVTMGPGRLTIRQVEGNVAYRKTGSGEVTIESVKGTVERLK